MRAFTRIVRLPCVLLLASPCVAAIPQRLMADDKGNTNPPAKADAPAPGLTERERILLDRVEQLEKRVSELEANKQPAPTLAQTTRGTTAPADNALVTTSAPQLASTDSIASAAKADSNNPGRYLVLLPPINGATAASGTPYFTENPGDPFKAWDASGTFDYMPSQYITFRWEFDHRAPNVPYWTGPGGITPSVGNTGTPGSFVPGFTPDLKKIENRIDLAILVKF